MTLNQTLIDTINAGVVGADGAQGAFSTDAPNTAGGPTNGAAAVETISGDAFADPAQELSLYPTALGGQGGAGARELLFARAKLLGHPVTPDSGVHLIADGLRIEPVLIGATRVLFALPKGCAYISLRSRCFVPAHTCPPNTDRRSLGICVGRLVIDGQIIPLDDDENLNAGWHGFEQAKDKAGQRWTKDVTPLPSGARWILIDLAGPGYYWQDSENTAAALAG